MLGIGFPLLKRAARSSLASLLVSSGAWRWVQWLDSGRGRHRVLVLGYHRVVEDPEQELDRSIGPLMISRKSFQRQMEVLCEVARPLSMDEVAQALAGTLPLDRDGVAITFDDGYLDVYHNALPVLKELGIPATVYVPSAHIGSTEGLPHDRLFSLLNTMDRSRGTRRGAVPIQPALELLLESLPWPMLQQLIELMEQALTKRHKLPVSGAATMEWAHLREMAAHGVATGVHTINHAVLTRLDPQEAEQEIVVAQETIEGHLKEPVHHFSYPNGRYHPRLAKLLRDLGFTTAVTTEDHPNYQGADPMTIGRSSIWEGTTRGVGRACPRSVIVCQLLGLFNILGLSSPMVSGLDCGLGNPRSGIHQEENQPSRNVTLSEPDSTSPSHPHPQYKMLGGKEQSEESEGT